MKAVCGYSRVGQLAFQCFLPYPVSSVTSAPAPSKLVNPYQPYQRPIVSPVSYVDAVGEDVATHTHVDASSLVVPRGELPLQLLGLLAQHMAQEPEYKVRAMEQYVVSSALGSLCGL